jgi:Flp pilus assembly protein TadG
VLVQNGTGTALEQQQRSGIADESNNDMKISAVHRSGIGWLEHLRETRGAQLLEFALVLPLLVVMAVGIIDFGGAYNVKHILTNSAREAARITSSTALTDSASNCVNATTPCSIQAAADAVEQYLTNTGMSAASCISPSAPSGSATLKWTYSCDSGNETSCGGSNAKVCLQIDRGYVTTGGPSGTVIPSTRVTLQYPYTWTYGKVIGLMVKGATASLPSTISTSVVMQNLAN